MTYTFPPNLAIEPIEENTAPQFRGSRFNEGEPETKLVVGQNQFLRTFSCPLKPMPLSDCRTVTEFLRARVYRNQWFWWQHPIHGNLKVRCRGWSLEPLGWGKCQIEVKLAEWVGL
jgi:phage-related protein